MKKVLLRGPLLSQSGYGTHSRQIFKFCETRADWDVSTQILGWGITPWCVNSDMEDGVYGRIMHKSSPAHEQFDITIQVQLPHEWDPALGKFNIGITAGVETDRCSVDWATTHREKMDLVIVPSSHTKSAFLASGTGKEQTPIKVIPEAYFSELLHAPTTDPLEKIQTSKNFLTVGTLTSDDPAADRKNLFATIKWFLTSFSKTDDVGLIVKTSKGRDTTIDRELVRKTLRQIVRSSNVSNPPKIYMLHGSMSLEEMNNLYKSKKLVGFVSATRGEGFGLPFLEAAVSGLPIIATNWSSYTEFLHGESFLAVHYDLSQIAQSRIDNRIFVAGARWADPREGNFKKKMNKLVANSDDLKLAAQSLKNELIASHSLENICEQYKNVIDKALSEKI